MCPYSHLLENLGNSLDKRGDLCLKLASEIVTRSSMYNEVILRGTALNVSLNIISFPISSNCLRRVSNNVS